MSLRIKFTILIALLALTISGSMGVVLWSFALQRSQLLGPFSSTTIVLDRLRSMTDDVQVQEDLLRAGSRVFVRPIDAVRVTRTPDPAVSAATVAGAAGAAPDRLRLFEDRAESITRHLAILTKEGLVGGRTGTIASRTLASRVEHLQAAGRAAIASGDADALRASASTAAEIRLLLDRLSKNVLLESIKAIESVEAVRRILVLGVFWAFAAAALLAMLALVLVRRWVLRPVAALRKAAARIAAGDFKHRVNAAGAPAGRDELAQLAREVDHMAGMVDQMLVERVERERLAAVGEMVRRLAHNLRNPLAGIRGLAELTRDETSQPEIRDAQDRIIGSVDRFERWLADLLSVTRPLAVNPERARVEPLLTGLVDAHRPMARTKEITLELAVDDAPAEAIFDTRHLEHSLVAILTNAIQASPVKGTVRIDAHVIEGAGEWEVRIADQGPGVPPDLAEKIFTAYFTTKKDGNGIGLAVAQQVVRAHGGRITIEPGLNGAASPAPGAGPGATFVVRIPVAAPPQATDNT